MQSAPVYPSHIEQKVLAQEAPGGIPSSLNVVLPSVTRPSHPFDVRISVLDENGYPSLQCESAVELAVPEQEVVRMSFQRGSPAVGVLTGVQLSSEGLYRLEATCGDLRAHSNPTLCTSDDVPGIYWGDPHVHTVLSNCHADTCRSLNFCFTAARHLTALDWVAAADHVSNGRCERSKWKEQHTVANLYNAAPAFATLPAYEASLKGGAGGDNNVYMSRFPDIFVDEFEDGNTKTLCGKLAGKLRPDEFFVAPHHTTRTGKHGEVSDQIYPGPDAMPVVEVHSKWGTSEYRGNPNPLNKIHEGASYAIDLLNRGIKLGFVAGTDTHATMPSGGGEEPGHIDRLPGLTAARCTDLNRQSVFNAIQHRQCYGASLERIILQGAIAGQAFGQELCFTDLTSHPKIDVVIAAKSDITQVDLVRNGKTIHSVTPDAWNIRVQYEDEEDLDTLTLGSSHLAKFIYYYVRVTCKSGAQAWSSPVWIVD